MIPAWLIWALIAALGVGGGAAWVESDGHGIHGHSSGYVASGSGCNSSNASM